jgi:transcription antitermination factor NusA-like protein
MIIRGMGRRVLQDYSIFSFPTLGIKLLIHDRSEMNYDYSKRDYLLPEGCKDLGDVLKLEALKGNEIRQPLRTNEEIRQVFRKYVPEIAAGTVEIVSMARIVGHRCLLVVRSHDPKVSAVQACSLERGERLNALIAELGGEFPSVILWQPSSEELFKTAFPWPAQVVLDSGARQAVVTIQPLSRKLVMCRKEDQMVQWASEMTVLVSELTGWKISLAVAEND